jgi:RHS repeat-associated protein
MVSRSRLVDERRREREGQDVEATTDRTRETPRDVAGSVSQAGLSEGPSSGTAKMMSASPVGNFYIYSFDGKLLQVYDVFGTLLKDYIYMGSRLVAEYDHVGARLLYYTPDQINTTRVVTDQSGNVVYSAVHDPYGGIQQTLVSTYDPQLKFSGKERDAESQLDYFGARYYDRSQYRFLSVDPAYTLNAVSFNIKAQNNYSYCLNNPNCYVDPNGAYPVDIYVYRMGLLPNGRIWGEVWIGGDFIAYSIELGWNGNILFESCIPEGDYDAYIGNFIPEGGGKSFQTVRLTNKGTYPRKKIAFHQGSTTQGCFLIGTSIDKRAGSICGSALQRMLEKINSLGAGLPPALEFVMDGFDALVSIADFPEITVHVVNTPLYYFVLVIRSTHIIKI